MDSMDRELIVVSGLVEGIPCIMGIFKSVSQAKDRLKYSKVEPLYYVVHEVGKALTDDIEHLEYRNLRTNKVFGA
jgi:hypothetical protein